MSAGKYDLIISLHEKNAVRMEQYAFRKTGDEKLAQDLVQEVFLTAILKIDVIAAHEKPDAWLFKTLYYIIKREMDLEYRKAEIPLEHADALLPEMDSPVPFDEVFPQNLTQAERELLKLRFEKQWSYDAIAQRKGISPAACRKQVSRALQHFREGLE